MQQPFHTAAHQQVLGLCGRSHLSLERAAEITSFCEGDRKANQATAGHYLPVGLFLDSCYSIEAANSSRLNLSFTETTVTEATAR